MHFVALHNPAGAEAAERYDQIWSLVVIEALRTESVRQVVNAPQRVVSLGILRMLFHVVRNVRRQPFDRRIAGPDEHAPRRRGSDNRQQQATDDSHTDNVAPAAHVGWMLK